MTVISKIFEFNRFGSPDVLTQHDVKLPPPDSGEIQIRHLAIGVNFIDIYQRKGVFGPQLVLPSGLGMEGVGIITAVGKDVSGFRLGDRIAYIGGPANAYSTYRNLPAVRALPVPNRLESKTVAAMLFKGLTAEYLIHRCVPVSKNDIVLLHAAAGGVGLIVTQWLKHIGATVIGTVSTQEKAKVARANGCDYVIIYTQDNFSAHVAAITSGKGVRVVYDSVGSDTFNRSIDCLSPRGTLVSFGESSGPVAPLSLMSLGSKGSLFVTRPSIIHYTANHHEYQTAAEHLFSAIREGYLTASLTTYPLSQARIAHEDIEARRTTGSVVLIP